MSDQGYKNFLFHGRQTDFGFLGDFIDHNFGSFPLTESDAGAAHLNDNQAAAHLGDAESGIDGNAQSGQPAGHGRSTFQGVNHAVIPFAQ